MFLFHPIMSIFKTIFLLFLLGGQTGAWADINSYFAKIKSDPNALYIFLKKMPKGGELHYHLAGGAYPEIMLATAARGKYCLDKDTLVVNKMVEKCDGLKLQELTEHPELYEKTIEAWSMKNFVPGKESGHDHFFNSFSKFLPIVVMSRPDLLASIMKQAAAHNEQYLEIMILPDNAHSASFGTPGLLKEGFAAAQKSLLANKDFRKNIHFSVDESKALLQKARQLLRCKHKPQQAACQLTIKFQYYVLREQPLEQVFAQALNAFAAVTQSENLLIAVNLVQAEDGVISLRDYHQQMQIFGFLRKAYPQAHLSLHAGELGADLVAPFDLTFHMNEAIHVARAERIGHATSIAFENNPGALLKTMVNNDIAVEINLTSNRKILNVYGKRQPLRFYLSHNIPVVLSTDDEGILRTDLTREYVVAAMEHGVDYAGLKMITRNALTYSFLPGKSLWAAPRENQPVRECQDLSSLSCKQFVAANEKARLQWQLEQKLQQFEKFYSKQ
jgi:adenosine deaminase